MSKFPGQQLTDIFKMVKNKGLDFKEAVVLDVSGEKKHENLISNKLMRVIKLISIKRSFQS